MPSRNRPVPARGSLAHASVFPVLALAAVILVTGGCHHIVPVDTSALDSAGMSYDSIQQAKALNLTSTEVSELAKAREGGLSDTNCVRILQISRSRNQSFTAGDTIAGLLRSGVDEFTVVELARLNQLGFAAGELEAMRLAGLSDDTILEVARHRAEGKMVLSGASLANMKNAGIRDSTLLELARRGVPDSQAPAVIDLRRRGFKDQEILKHFTGS